MRKFLFIQAILWAFHTDAQYDIQTINEIKAVFQTNDDQVAIDFLDSLMANTKPLKTVKYGDSDAPLVRGLLKTLFTDSITKYKYIEANSRIANLHICSPSYNYDLENEDKTFLNWINKNVQIIDTSRIDLFYEMTYDREYLYFYDKENAQHKLLRIIMIVYGDLKTPRDDPYNNLLSIHDTVYKY
jgi:hypothetical protein